MTNTQQNPLVRLPRMYPKQYAAVFAPERYSVIEASTKSGKTAGCLMWQGTKVMRDKKAGWHWWLAPYYSQANIAFKRAFDMYGGVCVKNEIDKRLTFVNGAKWCFKSGDTPDALYGEDVESLVVDEATRVKQDSWHAVRSTLTFTKGQVRLIGNVKGRQNWAYRMARRAECGHDDYSFHKITAVDAVAAGLLDQAEIDDAKEALPDNVFKELYLCEPSDDGGNPFGLKAIEDCVVDNTEEGGPCVWGVDLAKSVDWTVACGLDEAGNIVRLERWQSDWNGTRERLLQLLEGVQSLIDSTGVGDPIVEDLQRSGIGGYVTGFKFTSQSKQQIMEGLAAAIQRQEVHFEDGWLRNELDAFEYEYTRTGVKYTAPQGLHDDGVCALALAVKHKASIMGNPLGVEVYGGSGVATEDDDRMWQ